MSESAPSDLSVEELDAAFEAHCAWYEENLRIINKHSKIVPLKFNRIQLVLERYKWECRRVNKPCWMLILKARKEGVSTWAEATIFRDNREIENRMALVIAHDDDATGIIFGMTKFYHEWFPDAIPLKKSNARELHFEDTNALFRVRTAGGAGSVGRGGTYQAVHLSEVDKWPYPEALYQAVMQTFPDTGDILVIAESTADGPMLMMNQLWDPAVEGRSEYFPFFFPWWADEDYVREISFEDLEKYAPRDWKTQNKLKLQYAQARDKKKEERYGLGQGGLYGRGILSDPESRLTGVDSEGRAETDLDPKAGSGVPPGETSGESNGSEVTPGNLGSEGLPAGDSVHRLDSEIAPRRISFAIRELNRMSGDVRSKGTPWRTKLPPDRGSPEEGWDTGALIHYYGSPVDPLEDINSELPGLFRESMTPYETGLCEEYDLTLEQVNWLRYVRETKCNGDETVRRREYPSRAEEAFEASGQDILDPLTLAKWAKDAKDTPPLLKGTFKLHPGDLMGDKPGIEWRDDPTGKIEIYEHPKPKERYVAFLDPSTGVSGSDWQVCFVMNVESGDQAAEFRATMDPHEAVDQVEALCIHYNVKKLAIECTGGYGSPFIKHMIDRKSVPLYETKAWHKWTQQYLNKPGWDTNTKTRPLMVSESKEAVRKGRCKIKSEVTIRECRTLYESPTGKVEARPPNKDDGWMAYAGCLILRNEEISGEKRQQETDRKSKSIVRHLNQLDRTLQKSATLKNLIGRTKLKKKIIGTRPTVQPDKRRSWIG